MWDKLVAEHLVAEHAVAPFDDSGMGLENPYCIRYAVDGQMVARQGSMVAYRGDLSIRTRSQGVKNLLKRAVTGEGVALMTVEGRGDIWLADLAKNVFVLPGDGLSVAGKSVLCFDDDLSYEIRLIKGAGMNGGGLFNCVFSGAGSIAITAHGAPLVLPVTRGDPVFVDTSAVIGWTTGLQTSVHKSEGLKSIMKGGSGELFQLKLEGEGSVVVQPSEGPIAPKGKGVADAIGDML